MLHSRPLKAGQPALCTQHQTLEPKREKLENMSNRAPDSQSQMASTFSVSELNRRVKDLLEIHFPLIWVEGEISNLSQPGSGHWYFTLKDSAAQVSCAMFKRRNMQIKFKPSVGDHIKMRARVSLYEGRGDYQLIAEHMEQAGFGLLQRRFEELKQKLSDEGLFDSERKRRLPKQVQHLAVVTSPTGAAIRDVLSVLERRFPSLPITIIPSAVQGDEAHTQLVDALLQAEKNEKFDLILLCRGGGSIEDLWAFNHEKLARSIAQCKTPVVSAVGHEVDFTISDFVADLRAPTPSAAAELISQDSESLFAEFQRVEYQLAQSIRRRLSNWFTSTQHLRKQLKHPLDKLEHWHQRIDSIETRLSHQMTQLLAQCRQQCHFVSSRLSNVHPKQRIAQNKSHLSDLSQQLHQHFSARLQYKQLQLTNVVSQLDIVSPLATIDRGYSIVRDKNTDVVKSVTSVNVGDDISIRMGDGVIDSTVTNKRTLK